MQHRQSLTIGSPDVKVASGIICEGLDDLSEDGIIKKWCHILLGLKAGLEHLANAATLSDPCHDEDAISHELKLISPSP